MATACERYEEPALTYGVIIARIRTERGGRSGIMVRYTQPICHERKPLSGEKPMTVFTFHLAQTKLGTTVRALYRPPTRQEVPGLNHAECMTRMTLGAPILSPARMQLGHLTMFAAWESHGAIDEFLAGTWLGRAFATGWHVRMAFLRRWGYVREFGDLPDSVGEQDPAAPVVAVTLARMKLPQIPRFIHWGRPVEELVRDDPAKTLALAAMRLPNTVSTFSVWNSQREMVDMVR